MKKLLLFCLIALCSCVSTLKKRFDYKVSKDHVFKKIDGMELKGDFYFPEGPGKKPAVIVVHGGGWENRHGLMESICADLAQSGFTAFNITYRLAPSALYPKAVEDVKDAAQWLYNNADKFQIDRERIGGWGYSAGAQLILLTGLDTKNHLKAMVTGGSPVDFLVWPLSPIIRGFIGFSMEEREDLWREASPIYHIKSDSPPLFMYHGEWDGVVEIDQMHRMRDEMRKQKRFVQTYSIKYMGHIAVYLFNQRAVDYGIQFLQKQL